MGVRAPLMMTTGECFISFSIDVRCSAELKQRV